MAEAVEGAALPLEGVDDVKSSDGLAAGVLSVGDGVTDDVLKEDLEDTAGLLVDEAGDALDTTTASEAADGGLLQVSKRYHGTIKEHKVEPRLSHKEQERGGATVGGRRDKVLSRMVHHDTPSANADGTIGRGPKRVHHQLG